MSSRARAFAAAGLAAVVSLSGCSGSESGNSAASAAPTDKVLHLSFLQDPGQPPDPDIFYAGQGLLLTTNLYEGLLQYKGGTATPELEPLLATEWTKSPDSKVFTFTLRQGVKFHDGTPFTAAAVKGSFDRRLAVNQGPAYMVTGVDSVVAQDDYHVTITLKSPNSAFLDYLASAYGPRMLSPEGLKSNAGADHAETYLTTHDLGTGPFTLAEASVGSKYTLKAFDGYWGQKPYFHTVDVPVVTDTSSQQLQFNSGQLAAVLHDLPTSAVQSYLDDPKFSHYSLPTMVSNYLYVNPRRGMLTDATRRKALLQAVDLDTLVKQTYAGRGTVASQMFPPNVIAPELGKQNVTHDPAPLTTVVAGLPADQKSIVVGYDSSMPDNQLISNLLQAELAATGLDVKVQSYPTSQIFGWIGTDAADAPDILTYTGWPDAASPYMWGHISWDADGALNYFGCSAPAITSDLARGLESADTQAFSQAAGSAADTGCWLNMADVNDFMVAQPWLRGVEQAHVVTSPQTLRLAALSVG
ncbi:ABC transporter substrate-binding protein [Mycobacterium hodleri]|uniref:ABC transporter substrate-binding protein n=1 Tax=Mycolicibacterium hodleri TaxID=49897 RepID=UPI0021F295E2|nr:ABC transporter substrate-binding protein [Mycolicibacterium hodleri]MCV7133040.1 ABC transporter substrate-binding protein [Mycolicibacterium hodleri]